MADTMAYLKIDPIRGDSRDKAHPNWIEVLFFGYGPGYKPGDFKVTVRHSSASPVLLQYCSAGRRIDTAIVEYPVDSSMFLRFTLRNVIIADLLCGAQSDTANLNHAEITAEHVRIAALSPPPKAQRRLSPLSRR